MVGELSISDFNTQLKKAEEALSFKYLSIGSFTWFLFGFIGFRDEEERDLPKVMAYDFRKLSLKRKHLGVIAAVRGKLVGYTASEDRKIVIPGKESYGRILAWRGLTDEREPRVQEVLRLRITREIPFTRASSIKPTDLTVTINHLEGEDYEMVLTPNSERLPFGENHIMTKLGGKINLRKSYEESRRIYREQTKGLNEEINLDDLDDIPF